MVVPGWEAWFTPVMTAPPDAARSHTMVGVVCARPLSAPPAAMPELGAWQAFVSQWRQQWGPDAPDERGLRWLSGITSTVVHLLLALSLLWLLQAPYLPAGGDDRQPGDDVVEVTFIGAGTPDDATGGGPSARVSDASRQDPPPIAAVAPAAARPTPAPEVVPDPGPLPEPSADRLPEAPVLAPAAQPLTVTQVPAPDTTFVLPPAPEIAAPQATLRPMEVAPQVRDIEMVQPYTPRQVAQPGIRLPDAAPAMPDVALVERQVHVPLPQHDAPAVEAPQVAPATVQAPTRSVRERTIAMPERSERAGDGGALAAEPAPAAAPGVTDQDGAGQRDDQTPAQGRGQEAGAPPGRWASAQPADDWGLGERATRGGQAGSAALFNPDGSPRLPSGRGRVGGGLPPGTVVEDYENIDRMGTWLRRPPTDYAPTSFERFWVPHESMLQEWVRRSIRTVLIPIPGTDKRIRCDVATLMLAGGCGITDANMQDVEAEARPPPDVPFRPDLHEDQQGLSDDVWR